jgi:outer membrane protein
MMRASITHPAIPESPMRARLAALAAAAVLVATLAAPANAQDKIAYANLDLIVSLMPETKALVKEIDTLGKKLAKDLDTKESFAEQRAKEAREAAAAGASEADLEKRRTELRGLQDDLRKGAESADAELEKKRNELLKPVFEKLEKTIADVAKAEGFTYVLNAVDGQGNSIVLYGAEGRDITEKLMTKLGVTVPKPPEAAKKTK